MCVSLGAQWPTHSKSAKRKESHTKIIICARISWDSEVLFVGQFTDSKMLNWKNAIHFYGSHKSNECIREIFFSPFLYCGSWIARSKLQFCAHRICVHFTFFTVFFYAEWNCQSPIRQLRCHKMYENVLIASQSKLHWWRRHNIGFGHICAFVCV